MATHVKWFGQKWLDEIRKDQTKKMQKAVRLVRNEVVKSLGVKVGRNANGRVTERSKPGEPPRLETGELRRSIATEVDTDRGEVVGRVGTNKEYAKYLELPAYLNRPFLLPAVARTKDQVANIFKTPL